MNSQPITKGNLIVKTFCSNSGVLLKEHKFHNTILKSGRAFLAAALGGNLVTNGFQAFITHIAFGTGGVDGFGNVIPVSESQSGFIGGSSNVKALVECQSFLEKGQDAAVTFTGVIPANSPANSHKITQVGLVFSNGAYYAVSTWTGVDKDSSIFNMVDWTVTFL